MNALLLTLALASGPTLDLDQEVTFENPGGTLPAVLGKLGEKAGVEFDIHPDIAREIVIVRVEKVPLNKTLDKIAEVTGGKWFEQTGKIRFIVDLDRRNRDENEYVKSLLDSIATGKVQLAKSAQAQKYTDEDGTEYSSEPSVSEVLLNQIVQQIPNNLLASLRAGDRMVFSTNPTQAQRPMPAFNAALVQKWIEEHNELVKDNAGMDMEGMEQLPPELMERMMARFKKFEGTPSRMMLIVQDGGLRGIMMGQSSRNLSLGLYDQSGKQVIETSTNLGRESYEEMVPVPADEIEGDSQDNGQEKPPAKPQTHITYPEDLVALKKEFDARYGSGMPQKLAPRVREILESPDQYEPLALALGYSLVGAANTKKMNLVASPEDGLANYGQSINLADTVEAIQAQVEDKLVEADGWWTIKPDDPKTDRETRIDRKSLSDFLKKFSLAYPTLDDVAKLFADNDVRDEFGFLTERITMLCPQAVSSIMQQMNPQEYRLFGQLSPSQRVALKNGTRVSIGQLTPAAQQTLRRLVYGASTNLQVLTRGKEFARDSLLDSFDLFSFAEAAGDLKTEPTIVAPSGLPMQGYIEARVTENPYFVIPPGPDVPSELSVQLGFDEMAIFRAMMSVPEFAAEGADFIPMFDKMNRGTRDEWSIRVFVARDVAHKIELNDARPPGKEVFSIRNLPPDIEKIVAAKVEAFKKSPFFSMMGSAGSSGNGPIKP